MFAGKQALTVALAMRALSRVSVCGLATVTPSLATDAPERWIATSTTAISVTGDITFAPDKITFQNGQSLPLALIGHVAHFKEMGESVDATVYRVTVPMDPLLENENHLCGGGRHLVPVTYIALWIPVVLPGDKAPRVMGAFSGDAPPRAVTSATSCGIYSYAVPANHENNRRADAHAR